MAPPRVTTPAKSTVDYDKRYSEYDPHDHLDEDDLRQGPAPERPHKNVIILLDLDCYEAQVWMKEKRPELENQDVPVVVVNFDKIILAVNYTARLLGVERGNGRRHLEEMKQKNPQLIVIKTGELFEKQDCFTPQKRSDDIFEVLLKFQRMLPDPNLMTIERSSKDEVYIDVTKLVRLRTKPVGLKGVLRPPQRSTVDQLTSATKTHPNANYKGKRTVVMEGRSTKIHGSTLNYRILEVYPKGLAAYHADETGLAHGGVIALKLIKMIKEGTGFDASAGVAHNKLLAKLACDKNKPQGITIFTDISIPRLSKNLKFNDIPGYGSKRGGTLLAYFSDRGQDVRTLHDIMTYPFDALVAALKAVGYPDEETQAKVLLENCQGQDVSPVRHRHFADTINASINFRGTHYVRTWDDFKDRVFNLSRDVANRINYGIERWNRQPQSLVAKATLRKGSNTKLSRVVDNREGIDGFVDAIAIYAFILQYIKANNLRFEEIEDITVTVADFQGSSEDDTAAKGSRASKSEGGVKTMRLNFRDSRVKTLPQLQWYIGKLSAAISEKISFYNTTLGECPSELVVQVTLFDGAGPKVQLSKGHSLEVLAFDLPENLTINEFITGYIDENHLEAPQIEAIVVTLRGIQKIGS